MKVHVLSIFSYNSIKILSYCYFFLLFLYDYYNSRIYTCTKQSFPNNFIEFCKDTVLVIKNIYDLLISEFIVFSE